MRKVYLRQGKKPVLYRSGGRGEKRRYFNTPRHINAEMLNKCKELFTKTVCVFGADKLFLDIMGELCVRLVPFNSHRLFSPNLLPLLLVREGLVDADCVLAVDEVGTVKAYPEKMKGEAVSVLYKYFSVSVNSLD